MVMAELCRDLETDGQELFPALPGGRKGVYRCD